MKVKLLKKLRKEAERVFYVKEITVIKDSFRFYAVMEEIPDYITVAIGVSYDIDEIKMLCDKHRREYIMNRLKGIKSNKANKLNKYTNGRIY